LTMAYDRSVERGDLFERPQILFYRCEAALLLGVWDDAERDAEEGDEIADQLGIGQTRLSLRCARASVDAHRGREREAREAAQAVLVEAASVRDEMFPMRARRALGLLELSRGDAAAGVQHLAAFFGRREIPPYFRALPDAIEAFIGVGDLDRAEEGLRELSVARQTPWTVATAARCSGLLLAARGELETAIGSLDESRHVFSARPMPFEEARTLLCLGRTRRRAKQKRAAREALTGALAIFDRLGARLWAELAKAELSRIGGRAPGGDELTPTEREIAEQVASGLTNREVAERLFVAVRTVESNLSRVYGKLGVRSRTELARRLREP
jgi:DNA-binding CsgD family transcriptional regulator